MTDEQAYYRGREHYGPPPRCSRCGTTAAERVCVQLGLGGPGGGETYCWDCLSPEQRDMIKGLITDA